MNINPLNIGDISLRLPIIQGGMGIGVSLSNLAAAVTNAGGLGVISSAQIGFKEKTFFNDPISTNLKALKKEIQLAKSKCNNGPIGVNIMVATKEYNKYVKAAIESGADIIISGAGLPTTLPELIKNTSVKIAPIVSSLKAAKVLLKLWDKHYKTTADMIIIEGPKAGGHLGFSTNDLNMTSDEFDKSILNIIDKVNNYSQKYSKEIPVIIAGGVFDGKDIAKYINLGAKGVQIATRFVVTEECDASEEFKNAYIKAKKEDVVIVKSPVGMTGRAIMNSFIKKTQENKIKVDKCFNCLSVCNPKETPYCITKALINSVNGNINNGLIFCGENVYRLNKMTTVKEIFDELEFEINNI